MCGHNFRLPVTTDDTIAWLGRLLHAPGWESGGSKQRGSGERGLVWHFNTSLLCMAVARLACTSVLGLADLFIVQAAIMVDELECSLLLKDPMLQARSSTVRLKSCAPATASKLMSGVLESLPTSF